MTPVDARTLSQATASVIRKSLNSQKVSIVLPSIRPRDPPMSHISDNAVYASSASVRVYFSSEKYICAARRRHAILQFGAPSVTYFTASRITLVNLHVTHFTRRQICFLFHRQNIQTPSFSVTVFHYCISSLSSNTCNTY